MPHTVDFSRTGLSPRDQFAALAMTALIRSGRLHEIEDSLRREMKEAKARGEDWEVSPADAHDELAAEAYSIGESMELMRRSHLPEESDSGHNGTNRARIDVSLGVS